MKKIVLLLFSILLLHAQDKNIFTKAQLFCLNLKINQYLEEEADPVFVILESSCKDTNSTKTKLSSNTRESSLPNPDDISEDSQNGISVDDVRAFTKEELQCIKSNIQYYLNEKSKLITVALQCPRKN